MFVYLIVNLVTGFIYVGQTVHTVAQRWMGHIYEAMKRNSQTFLHRAIRKYGAAAFKIIPLVSECNDAEQLNDWERGFISVLRANDPAVGYNQTEGGEGGRPSDEVRQRMSERQRIRFSDPEQRALLGTYRRGTKLTAEHRQRISQANQGKVISEETRQRMCRAQTGKIISAAHRESVGKRQKELWQDPAYAAHMSAVHKGQRLGIPRTDETRRRMSAGMPSPLRGKEDEIKAIRATGTPFHKIASIYGVSKKAIMNVCRGYQIHGGKIYYRGAVKPPECVAA